MFLSPDGQNIQALDPKELDRALKEYNPKAVEKEKLAFQARLQPILDQCSAEHHDGSLKTSFIEDEINGIVSAVNDALLSKQLGGGEMLELVQRLKVSSQLIADNQWTVAQQTERERAWQSAVIEVIAYKALNALSRIAQSKHYEWKSHE